MAFAPSPQIEQAPAVEVKKQQTPPAAQETVQPQAKPQPQEAHPADAQIQMPPKEAAAEAPKDEVLKNIEEILSENQDDILQGLGELERQTFGVKGEELARTLKAMLTQAEIDNEKIDEAIIAWMSMVPGQNSFYIEQEALTKRGKLLNLREA